MQGRWGRNCEHLCYCSPDHDCRDGPHGDGSCVCILGREAACGEPSPLVPAPERPPPQGPVPIAEAVISAELLGQLRVDRDTRNRPRQVDNATVSLVLPTPLRTPDLSVALVDTAVAEALGIAASSLQGPGELAAAELFSGRRLFPGSRPYAHCYGGHQFGGWSGQLGDGRAISLGTLNGTTMHRSRAPLRWEVSLKGAGRTPYSRGGDGRAVLGMMLREALVAPWLSAVGVPAARSLAVVAARTGHDPVWRDEWYDGDMRPRPAGVLVRVSPSFLRFGSLQMAAKAQGPAGLVELARTALGILAELEAAGDVAAQWAPEGRRSQEVDEECLFAPRSAPTCAAEAAALPPQEVLACLLERAALRTAALVAAWQVAGFAHGVMNTDNLSILGITMDLNVWGTVHAPWGNFTPNHIDTERRYAYGNQPAMGLWGLGRLADGLTGTLYIMDSPDPTWTRKAGWLPRSVARAKLDVYAARHAQCFYARHRLRMGLPADGGGELGGEQPSAELAEQLAAVREDLGVAGPGDPLVDRWLLWQQRAGADYHVAGRALGELAPVGADGDEAEGQAAEQLARRAGARWGGELLAHTLRLLGRSVRGAGVAPEDWRRAVSLAAPLHVPRTGAVRRITDAAERSRDWAEAGLAAGALASPFGGGSCAADAAGGGGGELLRQLSELPAPEDVGLQSSCGGQ
eukprot:TRINITY_DN30989_c0_g1_i1.p2 TRINITY_DN30989_c0_g1~~TRINITY_DN30989_c0_g1_i1.p2  ORF type:complete len:689 (+),score=197.20 TRINITY_DN30989_c0_g1_i1:136-2202(+)